MAREVNTESGMKGSSKSNRGVVGLKTSKGGYKSAATSLTASRGKDASDAPAAKAPQYHKKDQQAQAVAEPVSSQGPIIKEYGNFKDSRAPTMMSWAQKLAAAKPAEEPAPAPAATVVVETAPAPKTPETDPAPAPVAEPVPLTANGVEEKKEEIAEDWEDFADKAEKVEKVEKVVKAEEKPKKKEKKSKKDDKKVSNFEAMDAVFVEPEGSHKVNRPTVTADSKAKATERFESQADLVILPATSPNVSAKDYSFSGSAQPEPTPEPAPAAETPTTATPTTATPEPAAAAAATTATTATTTSTASPVAPYTGSWAASDEMAELTKTAELTPTPASQPQQPASYQKPRAEATPAATTAPTSQPSIPPIYSSEAQPSTTSLDRSNWGSSTNKESMPMHGMQAPLQSTPAVATTTNIPAPSTQSNSQWTNRNGFGSATQHQAQNMQTRRSDMLSFGQQRHQNGGKKGGMNQGGKQGRGQYQPQQKGQQGPSMPITAQPGGKGGHMSMPPASQYAGSYGQFPQHMQYQWNASARGMAPQWSWPNHYSAYANYYQHYPGFMYPGYPGGYPSGPQSGEDYYGQHGGKGHSWQYNSEQNKALPQSSYSSPYGYNPQMGSQGNRGSGGAGKPN